MDGLDDPTHLSVEEFIALKARECKTPAERQRLFDDVVRLADAGRLPPETPPTGAPTFDGIAERLMRQVNAGTAGAQGTPNPSVHEIHGLARPENTTGWNREELHAAELARVRKELSGFKARLNEEKTFDHLGEAVQKAAWNVEWELHLARDHLRGTQPYQFDEAEYASLYMRRVASAYAILVNAMIAALSAQAGVPAGHHKSLGRVFAALMAAIPETDRLLPALTGRAEGEATPSPRLPEQAPELYRDRPVDPATGKREGIGQFLRRVWHDPWIAAGVLSRADFRRLDPDGEMALRNALRRTDHGLPPALHLPTRSEQVSRDLEQRTPDELRDAQRLLKARHRRTATSNRGRA
jgi:hypothetical protein